MSDEKEQQSGQEEKKPVTGAVSVIDALSQVASDPKVSEWFGRGGQKISYLNRVSSVGWNGTNVSIIEMQQITDEDSGKSRIGLLIRDGGYASNKVATGSGVYFFEGDTWTPSPDHKGLPPLSDNTVLSKLAEEYSITPEIITTKAGQKISIVPIDALPPDEKQLLLNTVVEIYNASGYLGSLSLKLQSDRQHELPRSFVERYALYKESAAKLHKIAESLPKYTKAFSGRDETIAVPDTEIEVPNISEFIVRLSLDADSSEGNLRNFQTTLSQGVSRALEGIAHDAFWVNDPRLASCKTSEEVISTLKEIATAREASTNAEIDINHEPDRRARLGKALGYPELIAGIGEKRVQAVATALEIKDKLSHLDKNVPLEAIQGLLHDLDIKCNISSLTVGSEDSVLTHQIEGTLRKIRSTNDRRELTQLVSTLPDAFNIRDLVRQQVLPDRWYTPILRLFKRG